MLPIIHVASPRGGRNGGLSPSYRRGNRGRSRPRLHLVCSWQVQPVHASGPDFSGRRRALGRPGRKGFLRAAFLLAVLEAGRPGCRGRLPHHRPPFMMLNKAASEPRLGCANTHIRAAGRSGAAELPHSWPAAPDLLDKGSFGPVGSPRELGALGGTALTQPSTGSSPLWLPPVIFIGTGL